MYRIDSCSYSGPSLSPVPAGRQENFNYVHFFTMDISKLKDNHHQDCNRNDTIHHGQELTQLVLNIKEMVQGSKEI